LSVTRTLRDSAKSRGRCCAAGRREDVGPTVRLDDLTEEFVFRAAHAEAIHLVAGGRGVIVGTGHGFGAVPVPGPGVLVLVTHPARWRQPDHGLDGEVYRDYSRLPVGPL
jgi:hypothetical protein